MTPVERFLADPDRFAGDLSRRLTELVASVDGDRVAAIVGVAVVAAAARGALRWWRHRRLTTGARMVAVQPPPDVDPIGAEALWATLHDLLHPTWKRLAYGQPHVGFEYQWTAAGMTIGVWVPGPIPPGLVERAVEAAWPAAHTTTTTPAADPLPAGRGAVVAGELRLAAGEWFPLRTDHDTDPLRALIGAATAGRDDDVVCVQILARPVTGRRVARAHRAARAVHTGRPATTAARLLDLAAPTPRARPSDDPARTTNVRAILDKASQPGWEIVVRYTAATTEPTPDRSRLRGRAHAVAAAFAGFTGRNRFARRRLHHPAATITSRRLDRGDLVGIQELAAVAHLPTDATVAGLARAGARSVAPPPTVGRVGNVLGDSDTGPPRPIALAVADARQHVHVMGATGSGKSTLLANLVLGDIAAGRGVVVVDPKGDLVTDILDRIPATATGRVVLLDPDETAAPPTLNLLDGADPDVAVDHLVGVFRRIYTHYWGPRTDDILRSACLTLLRRPPATLADVPRLLSDPGFRRPYLDGIADPVGLGGLWAWYDNLSVAQQAQVIGPVMNKLRAFLLRGFARATVGSATSSFSMADVLDRGGVCLARLPKGVLGDDTARLLGSFVVARAWHATTPARTAQNTPAATPRCTSTSATTSSRCPAASPTCSPKPAATTSRSSSRTNTSGSCRASCATPSRPTRAPSCGSQRPPTTRAPWNATSRPSCPPTTSPTSPLTRPPHASWPTVPTSPRARSPRANSPQPSSAAPTLSVPRRVAASAAACPIGAGTRAHATAAAATPVPAAGRLAGRPADPPAA